jgi:hypothetical protein
MDGLALIIGQIFANDQFWANGLESVLIKILDQVYLRYDTGYTVMVKKDSKNIAYTWHKC